MSQAALEAAASDGLEVEFGPFGTTVAGADGAVLAAADRIVRAAIGRGRNTRLRSRSSVRRPARRALTNC